MVRTSRTSRIPSHDMTLEGVDVGQQKSKQGRRTTITIKPQLQLLILCVRVCVLKKDEIQDVCQSA